jgi:hypothetical protein|tara:strand:- start:31 stop:327 length:297 start_codon:yes stop_codon:yes gene_type:complete
MATLEQHKAQVRTDHPENTVKVQINGTDIFLSGDEYDSWVDDVAASRLDDEQNGYKEDRKKAYASIEEQLDMMYWDKINNTTNWKDHITQVKLDNPKP